MSFDLYYKELSKEWLRMGRFFFACGVLLIAGSIWALIVCIANDQTLFEIKHDLGISGSLMLMIWGVIQTAFGLYTNRQKFIKNIEIWKE